MSGVKRILAVLGIAAASASMLPLAANASPQGVKADVDGDGRADPVSLRQVSEDTMLLRVGLRDQFVDATIQGNARGQELSVVDVNGDGLDEVMVPESVGANTITYTVWGYDNGLRMVRTDNADPWRLATGGGATAVSTYGCAPDNSERLLTTVSAYEDSNGDNFVFKGNRETYSVVDGVARVVDEVPIEDAQRDDPRLNEDPASCAPLP